MKTGLVLEGGALRGLFSAGVMDVMMENNIEYDGLIGVSAGAAFGCNYKSHQIGRVLRYNMRFANDWRYYSLRSLFKTGNLFNAEFDYHTIPDKLDIFDYTTFDESPMHFYAVCTDLETGKPVYKHLMKHGFYFNEWIRASSSMPLAAHYVELEGKKLLDGGISDSIPLRFFEGKGYNRNVVVLTQPEGYFKKLNPFTKLFRLQLSKYPNFLKAAERRPQMYNEQLAYVQYQEKMHKAFVIRPIHKLPVNQH